LLLIHRRKRISERARMPGARHLATTPPGEEPTDLTPFPRGVDPLKLLLLSQERGDV
jgi:hypothetical protein